VDTQKTELNPTVSDFIMRDRILRHMQILAQPRTNLDSKSPDLGRIPLQIRGQLAPSGGELKTQRCHPIAELADDPAIVRMCDGTHYLSRDNHIYIYTYVYGDVYVDVYVHMYIQAKAYICIYVTHMYTYLTYISWINR
jgi:hypothetical protein